MSKRNLCTTPPVHTYICGAQELFRTAERQKKCAFYKREIEEPFCDFYNFASGRCHCAEAIKDFREKKE